MKQQINFIHNPYVQLHFCVLLWGLTAILGKAISIAALPLVMWRIIIAVTILALFTPTWHNLKYFRRKDYFIVGGIGCLVSLHWITFYGSIKLSNASVAVTAIALGPVFSAFFEPFLLKKPFEIRALFLSVIAAIGITFIMGGLSANFIYGFLVGCFSAVISALFSVLNKKYATNFSVVSVTFIEFIFGLVFVILLSFTAPTLNNIWIFPNYNDWILLFILSTLCSLLPFCLLLQVVKRISAFNAQLAINLEPIYSIILAILIFNEQKELTLTFYFGIFLIIGSVLSQAWWSRLKS